MILTEDLKASIDALDYEALLCGWRNAPIGSPMFQGDSGEYWGKRLKEKRAEVGEAGHVAASKAIGWSR